MAFLIQPVADLIVPLYRIARNNFHLQRKEETEKFIQAACKISLAAALCFVDGIAQNTINTHTDPSSGIHLIGKLVAIIIIYSPVFHMHAYTGFLSRVLYYSFIGTRANKPAETKNFWNYFDLAATVFSLYLTSKFKNHPFYYKLGQQIVHLSKSLTSNFFEPTR